MIRLFVGNLNFDTSAQALRNAFEQFGKVDDVYIPLDRSTGRSRGFGFVTMAEPAQGREAIEQMNGGRLDGRELRVNEAEPKPPGNGQPKRDFDRDDRRSGRGGGGGRRDRGDRRRDRD